MLDCNVSQHPPRKVVVGAYAPDVAEYIFAELLGDDDERGERYDATGEGDGMEHGTCGKS